MCSYKKLYIIPQFSLKILFLDTTRLKPLGIELIISVRMWFICTLLMNFEFIFAWQGQQLRWFISTYHQSYELKATKYFATTYQIMAGNTYVSVITLKIYTPIFIVFRHPFKTSFCYSFGSWLQSNLIGSWLVCMEFQNPIAAKLSTHLLNFSRKSYFQR